jgi:hypothetical protein
MNSKLELKSNVYLILEQYFNDVIGVFICS